MRTTAMTRRAPKAVRRRDRRVRRTVGRARAAARWLLIGCWGGVAAQGGPQEALRAGRSHRDCRRPGVLLADATPAAARWRSGEH